MVELMTTELLSQNTLAGPVIGTPNIRSLYLRASIISTQICMAINSDPNVEVSTVFWALLYQIIGGGIQIYQYSGMGSPSYLVTGMIRITKNIDLYRLTSCFRSVWRDRLFCIVIKRRPIITFELFFVPFNLICIKYKVRLQMTFEVCKYMQHLLHVALSGLSHIG